MAATHRGASTAAATPAIPSTARRHVNTATALTDFLIMTAISSLLIADMCAPDPLFTTSAV
jgi:hypothetical protein